MSSFLLGFAQHFAIEKYRLSEVDHSRNKNNGQSENSPIKDSLKSVSQISLKLESDCIVKEKDRASVNSNTLRSVEKEEDIIDHIKFVMDHEPPFDDGNQKSNEHVFYNALYNELVVKLDKLSEEPQIKMFAMICGSRNVNQRVIDNLTGDWLPQQKRKFCLKIFQEKINEIKKLKKTKQFKKLGKAEKLKEIDQIHLKYDKKYKIYIERINEAAFRESIINKLSGMSS